MASRGRRLGSHAAGDRPGAQRIDDLPRPQQLAVMLGAVCHDFGKPATTAFLDGRIRSIDHEEQGVAPATRFLDRLNVHSIDGYDVRQQVLGLVAQHLKPGMWFKVRDEVGDGAFRRLAQKVDLELLARLAKSDCLGRAPGTFNCEAMDWFLERARALGVEHRPPAPILLGRHLLDARRDAGPASGRDPEGGLRAAARRRGHDARRGPARRGTPSPIESPHVALHARLRHPPRARRHGGRRPGCQADLADGTTAGRDPPHPRRNDPSASPRAGSQPRRVLRSAARAEEDDLERFAD